MAVRCEKCGVRVASRAALPGHYRRAHSRARRSVAIVSAKPKPEPIRAEVLDVIPVRSEIVRPGRASAPGSLAQSDVRIVRVDPRLSPPKPPVGRSPSLQPDPGSLEVPPAWWEPQGDAGWRRSLWARFPRDYRNRLLAQRAGPAFALGQPNAKEEVILWSQFHALKALATRLDAGIATEREREAFEAGLREYNQNFERIRAGAGRELQLQRQIQRQMAHHVASTDVI